MNVVKTIGGGPCGSLSGADGRKRKYAIAPMRRRKVRLRGVRKGESWVRTSERNDETIASRDSLYSVRG